MSEETFPYDQWVNEALRSVLSRALKQLSETGPIGEHHFFINFDTSHDEVEIPGFLRAQYPEEITIVLQHQFDQLIVDDEGFEVTLSFSGKKSRLVVPFDAVTSFADPSVNFGLQIGVSAVTDAMLQAQDDIEDDESTSPTPFAPATAEVQKIEEFSDNIDDDQFQSSNEDNEDDEADDSKTAEVITLDAFRKK